LGETARAARASGGIKKRGLRAAGGDGEPGVAACLCLVLTMTALARRGAEPAPQGRRVAPKRPRAREGDARPR